MRKKEFNFRPELLKKSISYCLKDSCSMKGQCLHYLAYDYDKDFMVGYFINPYKVSGNGKCPMFLSNEVQRVGRGFRRAVAQVPKGKITQIRSDMQRALNCCYTGYYKYVNGEKKLTPKKMEVIQNVFKTYGIASDDFFDTYEETYVID